ncbi:MAG TPA: SIMPL domain-containing protein [Bryobacteraceae bacterium]|nr:SIMPL domain-containing protein [Bryobacteraceae bacterium]
MRGLLAIFVGSILACAALPAQTSPPSVQATGNSTISVTPDQVQLSVSVITQGANAQEAGQLNAAQANTVQSALKAILGTNGTIQTVGYSVYPRYNTNGTTIIGYTASNTIQVTTTNLGIIGSVIDTANQAGASSVSGLTFGLQNPDPVLQQALTAATKQALGHIAAIATGLGVKTGSIISASESTSYAPAVLGSAPTASSTPISSGTVGVSATVTVSAAISQ